ncbi:copper resistance CopC/CopD family protein [Roseiflexus castenholzii]|jgi:copper transport protein|uniref:Copper resistance protein CopC n=1 Tax=Roseiflexus castenholzii (strain DSM 13941 / HLO8) TaxID=383372 RepID=A7NME4_ROSCS|nr:copper resistance protein CopC [Roseiflexus castenholzii]ABU58706.1 copper resistance protein CopC [Roseiflexus castenholzii DSM 13941]
MSSDPEIKIARLRWSACAALRRSVIGVIALLMLFTTVAYAHPQIVSAEPVPDARLNTAPPFVRIKFNEPIEESFASVQVLDATGRAVDRGDGGRASDDPRALHVSLPPLDPGVYTVAWQAVGRDGHLVKGYFVFTIAGALPSQPSASVLTPRPTDAPLFAGDESEAPLLPSGSTTAPPVDPLALLRSMMLIGAVLAIGGQVFRSVALTPGGGRLAAQMHGLISGALVLLLVATLLFFIAHAGAIAGVTTPEALITVARDTRAGQALIGRMALTLAFLIILRHSGLWARAGSVAIGGLILLTFSISGHAAATMQPFIAIMIDWVHLAAATIWVGGLTALTLALIQNNRDAPDPQAMSRSLIRFSWLALASVGALTISGALAACSYLNAVGDLWQTDYGRALLAKIVLFAILIGFGAYHLALTRAHTTERLTMSAIALAQRMRRSLPLEAAIATLVVGIAGVLTSLPHPVAAPTAPPVVSATPLAAEPASAIVEQTATPDEPTPSLPQPFTATQSAGDLRVALRVEPAIIGSNLMRITVTDAANKPRDVQRVRVMLRLNDRDIGETSVIAEPDGLGRYIVRNQMLGIAGIWRVQVQVRRIDADDVTADFLLPIRR